MVPPPQPAPAPVTPAASAVVLPPPNHKGITVIAGFKLVKGTVLVVSAVFALELRGHDLGAALDWLVRHAHLSPEGRLARWAWAHLAALTDGNLTTVGSVGLAYGIMQWVESYGLFRRRTWAEWLVVFATTAPVPIELYEMVEAPSLVKFLVLVFNLGIAGYLWYRRADFMTRKQRKALKAAITSATLGLVVPAPESDGPDHEVPGLGRG